MRSILSERNLVIVMFIAVIVTFAFAHENSKKIEQVYIGTVSSVSSSSQSLSQISKMNPASGKKEILPVAIRK